MVVLHPITALPVLFLNVFLALPFTSQQRLLPELSSCLHIPLSINPYIICEACGTPATTGKPSSFSDREFSQTNDQTASLTTGWFSWERIPNLPQQAAPFDFQLQKYKSTCYHLIQLTTRQLHQNLVSEPLERKIRQLIDFQLPKSHHILQNIFL